MDMVDIGGASKRGVPPIPKIQTVAFDSAGQAVRVMDDGTEVTGSGQPADLQLVEERGQLDDNVRRAAHAGGSVAYPDQHPGSRTDLQRTTDGIPIVGVSDTLLDGPGNAEARGDVSAGFKSDLVLLGEDAEKVDALLRELDDEEGAGRSAQEAGQVVARNNAGAPVIEVLFDTDVGAVASYYHKVVVSDPWLVLITDNTQAARQQFIPKARKVDGGIQVLDLVITGKDKREQRVRARPLNMTFTVDAYDITVMALAEDAEEA